MESELKREKSTSIKQKQPKVSCLMVTADRPVLFRRSLQSFLNQSYENRELVILDDGQHDLSKIIELYPGQEIHYYRIQKDPNQVLGSLRNMTLEKANGDYICQWDDDDWYHPERIEKQVAVLENGFDACVLSNTLMHLDQPPYFDHPYISYFKKGTPGSIMHRKDSSIRYPAMRRSEDDIYMGHWKKRRFTKLDRSHAHLFIRCFHGSNTWDMKHFLEQMRNTAGDLLHYYWKRYIRRNLFSHPRFKLDSKDSEAIERYLSDSFEAGLFKK